MTTANTLISTPAIDLASLDIPGLCVLDDFFEALGAAAMSVLNQPRCTGAAQDFIEDVWDQCIGLWRDAVREELERRTPTTSHERWLRAGALIRAATYADELDKVAALAEGAVADAI